MALEGLPRDLDAVSMIAADFRCVMPLAPSE
jgi:hypothetical protein